LYKNRSFPNFFLFVFYFFIEHFTIDATKKAVIVSQAQLFLIISFQHTTVKQHTLRGFKVCFLFIIIIEVP